MKLIHCIGLVLCLAQPLAFFASGPATPVFQGEVDGKGIGYTENKGQIYYSDGNPATDVLFASEEEGVLVFVKADGFSFVFSELILPPPSDGPGEQSRMAMYERQMKAESRSYRFDLQLLGANPTPGIETGAMRSVHRNYYGERHPDGVLGVHTFESVTLREVYPGIDLHLYTRDGLMKYDFWVRPGANPADIQMQAKGLDTWELLPNGSLRMQSPAGEVTEGKPLSFQNEKETPSRYLLDGDILSFDLPEYDPKQALIIDPIRVWASYFGASSNEGGESVSIGSDGGFFLFGSTASTDLPVASGSYQTTHAGGTWDIYLSSFTHTGQLKWVTYMGGSGADNGTGGMDVDSLGNVYIQGVTYSTDFPVSPGAFQSGNGGANDVFLASFDSLGNRRWATYLGGSSFEDSKGGVAVDNNQEILFYGHSASANFPTTPNAYQVGNSGSNDAYLVKFRNDGTQIWGTLFGGSSSETGQSGIAIDPWNNIYVGGETSSSDLPLRNAFQASFAGFRDAFIAKFTPAGDSLIWSTYYGGFSWDLVAGRISADANGSVYVAGQTLSSNFPTSSGAFQPLHGGAFDAFAMSFDSVGNRRWATFLGGSSSDYGEGGILAIDTSDIVMCGATGSANFPVTLDAFQSSYANGSDAFFIRMDGGGDVQYSTFIGGSATETYPADLDLAPDETVILSGFTSSTNFPVTAGAFQGTYGGGVFDAYLIKFTLCRLQSTIIGPDSLCANENSATLDLVLQGGTEPFTYLWTSGDTTQDVMGARAGFYKVSILDDLGCALEDSIQIDSLPAPYLSLGNDTTICEGDTLLLDAGATWNAYLWSDSSTFSSLQAFTSEIYSLEVTDSNGCKGRDSINLYVQTLPALYFGADTALCRGDTLYLDGGGGNMTYNWSTGSTQQILKVFETGTYSGLITDSIGCQNSDTVSVEVNDLPVVSVSSYGPATICIDDTLILEASPGTYASYVWNNGDVGPIAQATTGGIFRVTVMDTHQCQVTRSFNVTYLPYPDPSPNIIPSGSVEICNGGSLPVDAGQGYFAYDWSTGSQNQIIQVNQSGQYWVTVTNGFGCTEISDTLNVQVSPALNPTISANGNTLSTAVQAASYQWFLNGSPIPNASQAQYLANQSGTYRVEVVDSNGCQEVSPDYAHILNGLSGAFSQESFNLWPNPSQGKVWVELPQGMHDHYRLELRDAQGKLLWQRKASWMSGVQNLDLGDLSQGLYFLRMESGQRQLSRSLLIR